MTQLELGLEAKRKGKAKAAKHHTQVLEIARTVAYAYARKHGTVTADDVQHYLQQAHFMREGLGNAAGSIFDGDEWECVGYRPSTRPSRHGGINRIWRLK